MRKKAQEGKRNLSPSSSSTSSVTYQSELPPERDEMAGGVEERDEMHGYSMDQIWNEIEISEVQCKDDMCNVSGQEMPTPGWECWLDSLWRIVDEELKTFPPPNG